MSPCAARGATVASERERAERAARRANASRQAGMSPARRAERRERERALLIISIGGGGVVCSKGRGGGVVWCGGGGVVWCGGGGGGVVWCGGGGGVVCSKGRGGGVVWCGGGGGGGRNNPPRVERLSGRCGIVRTDRSSGGCWRRKGPAHRAPGHVSRRKLYH